MNLPIALKPMIFKLALAVSVCALSAMVACTSDSAEKTETDESEVAISTEELGCPALVENPVRGNEPLGPPPALPNLFTGTAYVDGEPVPAGEWIYVKLTTSRSHPVKILENGEFRDLIHGPVSDLDAQVDFVFCLGDPEGTPVKSIETFEFKNEPFLVRDVELNFPMLPSELSAQ
jgi:hypothetical protein